MLCAVGFLDFVDASIVNVALPSIRQHLHFSVQSLQWVLSGYLLTYGGLTDWREIVAVYNVLVDIWPSPVVALNRAVALGLAHGPEAGLDALDSLVTEPQLAGYGYFAAARADFLRRLGRTTEARTAYEEALLLTENTVERDFLEGQIEQLEQ